MENNLLFCKHSGRGSLTCSAPLSEPRNYAPMPECEMPALLESQCEMQVFATARSRPLNPQTATGCGQFKLILWLLWIRLAFESPLSAFSIPLP